MSERHPVGSSVKLRHDVDRYPHFIAPAGASGTVVDIGDPNIYAVRMDEQLPGAEEWKNEVHWILDAGDDPMRDLEVEVAVGDIVYCEGASAILGDVLKVDEEGVEIQWRSTVTTEDPDDIVVERHGVSETFRRYIDRGDEIVRSHPDFREDDPEFYETAASDQIANILHAVFDGKVETTYDSPQALLDHALRAYEGDEEDR